MLKRCANELSYFWPLQEIFRDGISEISVLGQAPHSNIEYLVGADSILSNPDTDLPYVLLKLICPLSIHIHKFKNELQELI